MEKARIGYARQMARKILKDCQITEPPVDLKVVLEKKCLDIQISIEVQELKQK